MRNQLTLLSAAFLLLAVGKVGHIGTLGQLKVWEVCLPLAGDCIVDIWDVYNRKYQLISRLDIWMDKQRLRRIVNRMSKKTKESI